MYAERLLRLLASLDGRDSSDQSYAGVDIKELLDKIGNALFQERLVWKYELHDGDRSGGDVSGLHLVLADPNSSELFVVATEERGARIATFRCMPDHPALTGMCRETRVDLGHHDANQANNNSAISPGTAIDSFLEAIAPVVVRLASHGSATPALRRSTSAHCDSEEDS